MEPPPKRSRTRSQTFFLSVKAQTWCASRTQRSLQAAVRAWYAMLPELYHKRRQREDGNEDSRALAAARRAPYLGLAHRLRMRTEGAWIPRIPGNQRAAIDRHYRRAMAG